MVQPVETIPAAVRARSRRLRPGIAALIYGGFFLLVAVIVAASLMGTGSLRRIERTFQEVQRVQRANDLADEIERRAYALRLAVRDVIASARDPAEARRIADNMTRLLRDAAPNLSSANQAMIGGMVARLARIDAALAPGGIATSAPDVGATTLDEEAGLISRASEQMRAAAARENADLSDHFADTIDLANRQSIAVGMICVLLGALCALLVVRRTVAPLRAIVGVMGRVTTGTTGEATPFLGRRDEIGDMARATDALKEALGQVRVAQESAQRALLDRRTVEAQYQQLFEQSADGIYQTTPDGRLLRANPALIAMMGYASLEEMLGALSADVETVYVNGGDHDRFRQLVNEKGSVRGFEYQARRRDGTLLWLSDSATVVRDETGAPIRYEGMLRDITDQKEAQAALAESRRRLREVIDTVPASINVKDRHLRFSIMNRYMANLLGIDPDHAIGRTTGELMARYSRSKSAEFDQEVLRTRKPLGYYEDQYADASGNVRHWLTTKIPLLDEHGEIESIVTCALDIGERKRAEAALQAAKETAEAATEAKSQFLAQMSHEIRTPMNGVLGMIEILEHTDLDDAQIKLVRTVRESATALLRIINDILDLSKLEANKLELEDVTISLAEILKGVEATLGTEARAKGLGWSIDLDPTLPSRLRGDPIRLRQVLLNLAANAVKFTSSGHVGITVEADPRGGEPVGGDQRVGLKMIVRDSGIGMDRETAQRLFQPFTQTDASISRRFGGTGLGLSICKSIVSLLGGTIRIESEPGKGSVFTVTLSLPRASADSVATDARAPVVVVPGDDGAARPAEGTPARGTILVADDHPTNRDVLLRQLSILGFTADAVNDGQEALQALENGNYALLLTDCHMPVMDGFELTAAIRAQEADTRRHLPIIAITANALVGESDRCLAAGMDGYMAKPVQIAQLRTVLNGFFPERAVPEETPSGLPSAALPMDDPVLDLAAMAALFGEDKPSIKRTLEKFVGFARGSVATVRAAADRDDLAERRREATRLSNAARTVGAQSLAAAAEKIAASDAGPPTAAMLDALARELAALSGEVRRLDADREVAVS